MNETVNPYVTQLTAGKALELVAEAEALNQKIIIDTEKAKRTERWLNVLIMCQVFGFLWGLVGFWMINNRKKK